MRRVPDAEPQVEAAMRSTAPEALGADLVALLISLGFARDPTDGEHVIFVHPRPEVPLVNLQHTSDGRAKPYQVRQVLEVVERYSLAAGAGREPGRLVVRPPPRAFH
jgi:hypothetical protein